jgi:S1-C subfamily serine protease
MLIGSFVGLLAVTIQAQADGVAIVIEIEGEISKQNDQLTIEVNGVKWTLEMAPFERTKMSEHLAKSNTTKAFVAGAIKIQMVGETIRLTEQKKISVRNWSPLIPGVIINSVQEKSSADGYLRQGDIILEINERRITSFRKLTEVLKKMQGKQISVGFDRAGELDTVEIQLRGASLGINGSTFLMRAGDGIHTIVPPSEKMRLNRKY